MSLSESPTTADGDSDPSVEIYDSDGDANASEEPEEEEVEVEEEEDDDEEEEEEEEVEEEIEEEEEEAEEEEDGEEGELQGEGRVTDYSVDADNDQKDLSQHLESEGQEGNLKPISLVAENPEAMQPVSVPSHEILAMEKEESHLKHGITSSPNLRKNLVTSEDDKSQRLDDTENADLCGFKDINSGTTKSSGDTEKDVVIDFLQRDCFVEDANGGQNSMSGMEMQSEIDSKHTISRCTAPDMRTRSLSPSAVTKDGSKRPAIICAFFAKGWCIRGSSCSFLHIKDNEDNTGEQAEGNVGTANWREVQSEEDNRDNAERSKTPGTPVPLAATLGSTYLYHEKEASPSQHSSQEKPKFSLLHKDNFSSEDNPLPTVGGSSTSRDSLFPENRFAFNASKDYFSTNFSSYPTFSKRMATIQSQHVYDRNASLFMSHYPNSSLVTHPTTTSTSLSRRISAQSEFSFSFSSSFGASTSNAQKLLNSDKEYHAFRSTSSGSERKDLPPTTSLGVPTHPTGCKSKFSSYDWEPSIPFRPSFFITSTIKLAPGDQYDPLRDRVEIPNIGDGSLKASFFVQGSLFQASSQVQTYGESAVAGNYGADLNDDKSSVSSHNRFQENEPNKSHVPREKCSRATETETTAGTYVNCQNGEMGMGENTFGTVDISGTEKERALSDARHQSEGTGHRKKRVDMDRITSEMDVEFQMDCNVQKESKATKTFRVALVDLVKDLLKPTWHEGRLSKDAHNLIVKKSVDKVLSTIQPHQIPTTTDTVKHYVSSSRVKIAKLVDGYVNKYGKC